MRIPNIYSCAELRAHSIVELDEGATQHIVKVLRMKKGYQLRLFNGDGYLYNAELHQVERRTVSAFITDKEHAPSESSLYTHLGLAISRGDRMDYAVQKAVELGVSEITPLTSERCEVKLDDAREDKRLKRWRQVIISACEQCGRAIIPNINPIVSLADFLAHHSNDEALKLVLHHRDTQDLATVTPQPQKVIFLVGPEGGLTTEEIEQAKQDGYRACTLGPRVFRTETAPVATLAVMQWLWGDFQ